MKGTWTDDGLARERIAAVAVLPLADQRQALVKVGRMDGPKQPVAPLDHAGVEDQERRRAGPGDVSDSGTPPPMRNATGTGGWSW